MAARGSQGLTAREAQEVQRELQIRAWAWRPDSLPQARPEDPSGPFESQEWSAWLGSYDRADALSRSDLGAALHALAPFDRYPDSTAHPTLQLAVWSAFRKRQAQGRVLPVAGPPPNIAGGAADVLMTEWGEVETRFRLEFLGLQLEPVGVAHPPWIGQLLGSADFLEDWQWERIASSAVLSAPHWSASDARLLLRPDGGLHLARLWSEHPSLLHLPWSAACLESLRARAQTPLERATVEGFVLARTQLPGARLQPNRERLQALWFDWRDEHGQLLPWQSVDARKEFLDRVARLGDAELGRWLWTVAVTLSPDLNGDEIEVLGGLRAARQDFLSWACDALPIDEILQRATGLPDSDALWVADDQFSRLAGASLPALRAWTSPARPTRVRTLALSAIQRLPASPARRELIVSLWADEDFEVVQAALQGSRDWELSPEEESRFAEAWFARSTTERMDWLREVRIETLPESIVAACRAWLREDHAAPPYLMEVVARRSKPEEALDMLQAGWRRDFEEAQIRWPAEANAGIARLASWVAAAVRLDADGLVDWLPELWLERVRFLQTQNPARPSYALGKTVLSSLARTARGRAWLRERIPQTQNWPRRLRVEVALQLAPHSGEELGDPVRLWLREVFAADYAGLGVVLRERWWKAMSLRPETWQAEMVQVAQNRREPGTVREQALRALAAHGHLEPLWELLAEERPGEGVWLAAEVLASMPPEQARPGSGERMRARIAVAVAAVRAGGKESELAEETLTALQLALVRAGFWRESDGEWVLLAPFLRNETALWRRLRGETKSENWPRETSLVGELAARGLWLSVLEKHAERYLELPGPILARLAQVAWLARDSPSAAIMARMAEIALAGEALDSIGLESQVTIDHIRWMLALQAEDWASVQLHSLRMWHRMQSGGPAARRLESQLGLLDWRQKANPSGRLIALWWQAAAFLANERGDAVQAKAFRDQAGVWVGRSEQAQALQTRLSDLLDPQD